MSYEETRISRFMVYNVALLPSGTKNLCWRLHETIAVVDGGVYLLSFVYFVSAGNLPADPLS
jgi:hypothetical protein